MKRFVFVLLVTAVLLSLIASCAPTATPVPQVIEKVVTQVVTKQETVVVPAEPSGGLEFAFVAAGVHSYYVPAQQGAADAAEDLKVNYGWFAPTEFNTVKQIELIESLLSYPSLKGMTLNPADPHGLDGVIAKAHDKNVKVGHWGVGCAYDGNKANQAADFCFAPSFYNIGVEGAKRMAKEMGEAGEVVIAMEMIGDGAQDQRRDGFKDEITKNHPNIKIVDILTNCDPAGTTACAETALAAHPNMKGYYGTGQNAVTGAVTVFPKAGKKDCIVSGADDPPELLAGIKAGVVSFTYSQAPYASGYIGVYAPWVMSQGKTPTQPAFDTGIVFIDKNNVDSYTETIKQETARLVKVVDTMMK